MADGILGAPSLADPSKRQASVAPSFAEYVPAAFRHNNPIYNVLDLASRPEYEVDPEFDFRSAMHEYSVPEAEATSYMGARNLSEFGAIHAREKKRKEDALLIASAGTKGLVASMAAGALSPSMLVPLTGQARGAAGIAQAFSLAAAASSVDAAMMDMSVESFSDDDVFNTMAFGTVLGGLLGSASKFFTPAEGKAVADAVNAKRGMTTLDTPEGQVHVPDGIDPVSTRQVLPPEQVQAMEVRLHRAESEAPAGRYTRIETSVKASAPETFEGLSGYQAKSLRDLVKMLDDGAGETVGPQRSMVGEDALDTKAPFLAVGDKGQPIDATTGVRNIVLQGPAEGLAEDLRRAYPDRNFMTADEFQAWVAEGAPPRAKHVPDTSVSGPSMSPRDNAMPKTQDASAPREAIDSGVGAAQTRTAVVGYQQPKNFAARKAFNALAHLNPITRSVNQSLFPRLSVWASRMQNPGLRHANIAEMQPNVSGGTVHARIEMNTNALLGEFVEGFDNAYTKYMLGKTSVSKMDRVQVTLVKSGAKRPPNGKLTFQEYSEQVFLALNRGELEDAALGDGVKVLDNYFQRVDKLHDQYLDELRTQAGDEEIAGLYEKVSPEEIEKLGPGVKHYAHHQFDTQALTRRSTEFIKDASEFGERILNERFGEAFERFSKRRSRLQAQLDQANMSEAQLDDIYNDLGLEIELIEEVPAYADGMETLRQIREDMREAGESPEAIKKAVKDAQDNFGPEFKEALNRRRDFMSRRNAVRKLGGGRAEKQAEVEARVSDIEALQLTQLEQIVRDIGRINARVDRSVKGAAKKRQTAVAKLRGKLADLEKLNVKLSKVRPNTKRQAAYTERLQREQARLKNLQDRLAVVEKEEGETITDVLVLQEARDYTLNRQRVLLNRRHEMLERAEEKLEKLSPEEAAKVREDAAKSLRGRLDKLEDTFDSRWREEGAEGQPLNGAVSFRTQAYDDAVELHRRLAGAPDRAAGMALIGAKRGAQLKRTLAMPFETKQKWLVKDAERVARSHARHMIPDLEIWRMTGSVNGARIFDDIKEDALNLRYRFDSATHVILPSGVDGSLQGLKAAVDQKITNAKPLNDKVVLLAQGEFGTFAPGKAPKGAVEITEPMREVWSEILNKAEKQAVADMQVVIDRARNQRGINDNPDGWLYRIGDVARNLNVVRYMGKVVLSSLPDIARPLARHSMRTVAGKAWLPTLMNKEFRQALKETDRMIGIGLDPLLHNRAQALSDFVHHYGSKQTMAERGLEFLANKTGMIAMFDQWTAFNKHIAAAAVHSSLATYIPMVAKGLGSEAERTKALIYLRRLGLDDNMIRRMSDMYDSPTGAVDFQEGLRLPNIADWEDAGAAQAYGAALNQEVNDLIITPGYDVPSMMDANLGTRLLFQFKSFTFASSNRIMMSGLQGNDAYLMQMMTMSIALGSLSYYTWAISMGGDALKEANKLDEEKWIYEAVNRSGLLGILSIGQSIGEQIPAVQDWAIFGGEDRTTRRQSSLMGSIFGPSYDLAERLSIVAQGMDDPTISTLHTARSAMVPYQNHFLFTRALKSLTEAMGEGLGFPERRQQ